MKLFLKPLVLREIQLKNEMALHTNKISQLAEFKNINKNKNN